MLCCIAFLLILFHLWVLEFKTHSCVMLCCISFHLVQFSDFEFKTILCYADHR